jgi:hypothetical protein
MTRLYEGLFEDSEFMKLRATFFGTRGRSLTWNSVYPFQPQSTGYVASRPQLEATAVYSLAEWKAGISDHAIELASKIMSSFGLRSPDVETMKKWIADLFARRF